MTRTKSGVRVIAGTAGGRRLVVPSGTTVRPMTDRMKESVFSRLGPIPLPDRTALDLFAGSGSLGLEALSRGVDTVTFVERDQRLVEAIKTNLAACGFEGRATVTVQSVERLARSQAPGSFDLVFADPPYPMSDAAVAAILDDLVKHGWVHDHTLLIAHRQGDNPAVLGKSWEASGVHGFGSGFVILATVAANHGMESAEVVDL